MTVGYCATAANAWYCLPFLAAQRLSKHSAADVVADAQPVLSESDLLRAMFDVGYFPPNTPPDG
jgi:hypothetical protein